MYVMCLLRGKKQKTGLWFVFLIYGVAHLFLAGSLLELKNQKQKPIRIEQVLRELLGK